MDINLEHLINSYKTTCNLSNNTIIAKENFKNLMNDNNSVILQVTEDTNTTDHQLKELAIIDLQNNELFNRKFYLSTQFAIEWDNIKKILKNKNVLIYNVDFTEFIIEQTLRKCSIYENLTLNTTDVMTLYSLISNDNNPISLQDACADEGITAFITDNALKNSYYVKELLDKTLNECN